MELGLGAVVSCAAIFRLRAFASFSSFSERLALRERPEQRGDGGYGGSAVTWDPNPPRPGLAALPPGIPRHLNPFPGCWAEGRRDVPRLGYVGGYHHPGVMGTQCSLC